MKTALQKFGKFLSAMVMPNIGAFIAWGFITALFIADGWLPNEQLASIQPYMLTYLLPILIAASGGKMIAKERGQVMGAIAVVGCIAGVDGTEGQPMLMAAMIIGPFAGWVIKKFDQIVEGHIPAGFEMLVNNFSVGILGMIVAIVSMEIYCRLADSGKLAIKMPESVPSNVSSAFNALFPAVLTILIISAFGLLFTKVTGNSIYNMISTWIQAPLRGILTGLPGYLLIFFLSTCFWVIGIHGTQVLKPVYQATMLEAVIANTDAAANGQTPQFILNETFISCFTTMGGAGCTIGLLFAMLLASKRSDHRTIAKLSLAPGLFNINETMTFGLPIVLNPIFMIPFILTPVITATFAYFMTVIGFCGKMIYAVPWTTPPLLIAWLGSGGSIGAVITQALCVVLSFIVYLPFVFAANKQEN